MVVDHPMIVELLAPNGPSASQQRTTRTIHHNTQLGRDDDNSSCGQADAVRPTGMNAASGSIRTVARAGRHAREPEVERVRSGRGERAEHGIPASSRMTRSIRVVRQARITDPVARQRFHVDLARRCRREGTTLGHHDQDPAGSRPSLVSTSQPAIRLRR